MKQFAVIGNPIAHSKSPLIHQTFAKQLNIELSYELLESAPDKFKQTVDNFFANGGTGLNVTTPFKNDAYLYASQVSSHSKIAEAANTLYIDGDTFKADTTDGVGLVTDLKFNNVDLKDKRILVLGAGGAAKGAILALVEQNPKQIVIANRTKQKAEQIVSAINSSKLLASGLEKIDGVFDVVINSTSCSITDDVPEMDVSCFNKISVCYDMSYKPYQTSFNKFVLDNSHPDVKAIDGLGMLVEQAAESFLIWHGIRPDTSQIRTLLRKGG
ncbi:shikimate dehydrogenase (NADP(+)) [Psychrosphaera saromensis]|uniref:Shikimate dehydrogenase (NADP(+)) n=1 Tax=Psychrosphaera saromensis TaxID=716813 RepID=A0A2S7USF7_9GAMM|nr:shikimate dehydrogenase [Psychrosphaera saromensis]PQJ52857.1 shikimate dehydrogenase [Psychrosphaera saromensis]GHB71778.1 shikimate dehydrogenase (NADP(+)) [Psychrosphaera saromensis]GLQ13363.1 shikimate dehydrogenase (NADP(+)) [Psychrosphaera saromensis]